MIHDHAHPSFDHIGDNTMGQRHVSEIPLSDGDAAADVVVNRLNLTQEQARTEILVDAPQQKNALTESATPEAWVHRMLRSAGGVIVFSEVIALISDLTFAHPLI